MPPGPKQNGGKPNIACNACRKSHVSCERGDLIPDVTASSSDAERPCRRCQSRGLVCEEVESKRRKTQQTSPDAPINYTSAHVMSAPSVSQNVYANPVYQQQHIANIQGVSTVELDEWSLLLGSSPSSGIELTYAPPVTNAQPPSLYVRPLEETKRLQQLIQKRMGSRLTPEVLRLIGRTWETINSRIHGLQQFVTAEQKQQMVSDYKQRLHEHTQALKISPAPSLIWERSLRILYVNPVFKKIVEWNDWPLPTEDFTEFMQMLSPVSVRMMKYNAKMFLDVQCDSITTRIGFRRLNTDDEVFTEGNGVLNVIRDQLGLPELFICQFVPDPPSDELPIAEMEDYRNMVFTKAVETHRNNGTQNVGLLAGYR
ncbi:hypothetical protein PROFUN_07749 [Planoprotostelium fungivorum]|uniref:Zn(2)-C6 fungal-type domain-containing protein n=1 Tax=Planoprotostelium fungivorum TaxID=1890364 RepID=A0A2P6N1H5_9EUKA|nr:hypothetical protein PROFUN_07749 [Planoprotostelium fungivorum]